MRLHALALALCSLCLALLTAGVLPLPQESGVAEIGTQTDPVEAGPEIEPDFRARLQRARQLLAEFERSREAELAPRGWLDPILGYVSAPEPGVRRLSLAVSALEPGQDWQPRQELAFGDSGRLEQVLTWSSLGPFAERVELRYDEQGRLRTREHYGSQEASGALQQRLLLEPREGGWRSELYDELGRLVCVEHWDERAQLLSQCWPLVSALTVVAERDPEGRLLALSEQGPDGPSAPLLAVQRTPPLTQFSLWHRDEAIPFRIRVQGPADPGQTIDVVLEPQGVRVELQQERAQAPGVQQLTQVSLRVWQPPRRPSQPLFPRFEPVWLERGVVADGVPFPLDFEGGGAAQRVELGAAGELPAEGALRLRPTELRAGLWVRCEQERYSRRRKGWEPAGLRVRRDWTG